MRIWSLHPKYLDTKGLVALWRESLLAKHVLEGKTKGYRNHPQLARFKNAVDPSALINQYLTGVYDEASARGYNFDKGKIDPASGFFTMPVTNSQMRYEMSHLLSKLKARDETRYCELKDLTHILPHPLFEIVEGGIENWEII